MIDYYATIKKAATETKDVINKALIIAASAHDKQRDRGKYFYIMHPLEIATKFKAPNVIAVAILHDVIEDNDIWTLQDLIDVGFSVTITKAVEALTRREHEVYVDYIKRVGGNPIARDVKLEDLKHNMDVLRLPYLTEKELNLIKKYQEAYAELFVNYRGM